MTLENKYFKSYSCAFMGVAGTTNIVTRCQQKAEGDVEEIWEARVGIAIMGYTNNDSKIRDPFDHRFRDNYARGFGTTEAKAIEALRLDAKKTSDSLWAE